MPSQTLVVRFERERETKNMVRFQELADTGEPVMGGLYVHKRELARLGSPDELTVEVRAAPAPLAAA